MNWGKYGIGEYLRFERWEIGWGWGLENRYQTVFILGRFCEYRLSCIVRRMRTAMCKVTSAYMEFIYLYIIYLGSPAL